MSKLTTIVAAKTALQNKAAEDMMADYKEYRQAVLTDGNVEDKRKLVDLQMRLTGAEADKKTDPLSNLPVFNFIINRDRGEAAPAEVEVIKTRKKLPKAAANQVTDVTEVTPKPLPVPSSLDVMFTNLDSMLGPED
jgi:hypothetical protein